MGKRRGVVHRVGSHRAVVSPPLPVDFLKVVVDVVLVDPIAPFNILGCDTDVDSIFDDLRALGDICAGDLMAFFNKFTGRHCLTADQRAFAGLNWFYSDGHIVAFFN